jgi:hypothetical protein
MNDVFFTQATRDTKVSSVQFRSGQVKFKKDSC